MKLIGNCLELFYIINSMQISENIPIDYKARYNNYRITALEKVELSATSISQVQNYKQTVKELIENDDISLKNGKFYWKCIKSTFEIIRWFLLKRARELLSCSFLVYMLLNCCIY